MGFIQYSHHGAWVSVDEELRGKHREHCLCYSCEYFHPGRVDNCRIAEKLYAICVEESLVTPVYECPAFKEKQ